MIVVDTSGLIALLDRGEPMHGAAHDAVAGARGPLVVTDFVLAETDYLVLRRLGRRAEAAFIAQLVDGVFLREAVTDADLARASDIIATFVDHDVGLTDATLLAVAERLHTRRILSLDHRHLAVFRDRRGQALELVPAARR